MSPVIMAEDLFKDGVGSEDKQPLRCDSCDEPIQSGEKYWAICSVGRDMDPEGDSDYIAIICLMCCPHGFEISLEVNEEDE